MSIKVWFDPEGDFLEVMLSEKPGFMRETAEEDVMERVDEQGALLGFSIMNVSRRRKAGPLALQFDSLPADIG